MLLTGQFYRCVKFCDHDVLHIKGNELFYSILVLCQKIFLPGEFITNKSTSVIVLHYVYHCVVARLPSCCVTSAIMLWYVCHYVAVSLHQSRSLQTTLILIIETLSPCKHTNLFPYYSPCESISILIRKLSSSLSSRNSSSSTDL